jgi:GntR family transcriptional regulator, transcriptional repressor for pyruvate dehydrogenase complex
MDGVLTGLRQAKKTLMVEHTVVALRDYIVQGNLSPGTEFPPESEMAKKMGVSKFSLREALRALQVLGLIDISQGRRTRVASHSFAPVISLLQLTLQRSKAPDMMLIEARKSLEGHISRYAAMRADDSHIKLMRQAIEDMKKCSEGELDMCVDKDIEFHNAVVKASGNVVFEIMLAPLMELLRDQRTEQIKFRGIDTITEYHSMILEAIIERDPDKAQKLMDRHLVLAEEDVMKAVKSLAQSPV